MGFAVLTLSAIVVRQGIRIGELEVNLASAQSPGGLTVGTTIRRFVAHDIEGNERTIDFTSPHTRPTIIYVFRPSCGACRLNGEGLAALLEQTRGKYEVVGLSLDRTGVEQFVAQENMKFPVYTDLSREDIRAYRLGNTPETIVVEPGGKVAGSWVGGFGGPTQSLIERYFAVRLPGFPGA